MSGPRIRRELSRIPQLSNTATTPVRCEIRPGFRRAGARSLSRSAGGPRPSRPEPRRVSCTISCRSVARSDSPCCRFAKLWITAGYSAFTTQRSVPHAVNRQKTWLGEMKNSASTNRPVAPLQSDEVAGRRSTSNRAKIAQLPCTYRQLGTLARTGHGICVCELKPTDVGR